MKLPAIWSTDHRYLVTGIEALGLTCARLRTAADLDGLVAQYGRSRSAISEIITETVIMLDSSWSHLLDFDHVLLSPENLARYANAVHNRGAPMWTIWGFIDCTIRHICRPIFGQRIVYSGHKKFHALKFQAIMLPCGLIGHLFGPWEGRRADPILLAESGLLDKCRQFALQPGTTPDTPRVDRYFHLYGDPAYGTNDVLISPFSGPGVRSPEEQEFNTAMSAVRIEVEHGFAVVVALWPFLRAFWAHRINSTPMGRYYRVAVLLTNA
jgi:hypothetical protein